MIPGGMGDQFSAFYREAYPAAVRLVMRAWARGGVMVQDIGKG